MSGNTHRVTRKRIVRSKTQDPEYRGDKAPDELEADVFQRGDTIEPTEDELRAFGDRLEELHPAEQPSDDSDEASEEEAEEEDEEGES